MDIITKAILGLFLQAVPADKASPYSFELVDACGQDPAAALCPLEPQCSVPDHFACAPPRWSDARTGWVVVESKEHKVWRLAALAEQLRKAALWHTRCRDPHGGAVTEACHIDAKWPEGPSTLAMAAATVTVWESGLREDIQYGHAPMGRGPGGEGCTQQIMPEQVLPNATWLPPERRCEMIASMSAKELREWGERAVLEGPDAQFRCYAVSMNMLARARRACSAKGPWVTGMFSMYGTGKTCNAAGIADDFHLKRAKTYRKFRKSWDPKRAQLPDDVVAILGDVDAPARKNSVDPRLCAAP